MADLIFADTGANQADRDDIKMACCPWCLGNEKMIRYHDEEQGVPVHDDRKQFEFLMMEVMQCGPNWNMMIQKRAKFGSFSEYIWGFTRGRTYLYMGHQKGGIPARNGLSDRISADLKRHGLKYMGSVTVYSHLQACGIINDHWEGCFRYKELISRTNSIRKRRERET